MQNLTTIYCTSALKELWPRPLASWWRKQYPGIFDKDDFRLTKDQGNYHFFEWFAAIHLFQRDGVYSLVEKYDAKCHPIKTAKLLEILGEKRIDLLGEICGDYDVQPPDLFVYRPDGSRFGFAEVKRLNETLQRKQADSHDEIARRLKVPVELIRVKLE
jgi:hypothetical protein